MSKKQFDHIENKIREAAENSEPTFDEQAWDKMEAKLNNKNDKRRSPFLWLSLSLLSIILLGGAAFFYNQLNQKIILKTNQSLAIISNTSINKTQSESMIQHIDKETNKSEQSNSIVKKDLPRYNKNSVGNKNNVKCYNEINDEESTILKLKNHSFYKKTRAVGRGKTTAKIIAAESINDDKNATDSTIEIATSGINNDNKKDVISFNKNKIKDTASNVVTKSVSTPKLSKDSTVKKESTNKKEHLYLLAAIGADASNVSLFSFKNSSITPRFGLGIGYQINNKISVQTGFYLGRKKYVAGPNDYHSKDGAYLNSVNISKIDANCLIYEIPITIRYNILQRLKITYYATAGVSSFIMKNEAYEYYYTTNNMNYEADHTYTGNTNLFSIATLSIGAEKKISTAFSIQIEPSINIPIAGVGEGAVKLYSTDLQLGLKYNFLSKKRK